MVNAKKSEWTVKEVAAMTGLTVRALHHYDEIGLVSPRRDVNDYRKYGQQDLQRLHEVRVYRELELDLAQIRILLSDNGRPRSEVLQEQRAALEARIEKLMDLSSALDKAAQAERAGIRLTPRELFEVFGDFDPSAYVDEVQARWSGDRTDESRARTRSYSKAQWQVLKAEGARLNEAMAAVMQDGEGAASQRAVAIAEKMRLHIDRRFYPCPRAHHAVLAVMYTEDRRFEATYEATAAGRAAGRRGGQRGGAP